VEMAAEPTSLEPVLVAEEQSTSFEPVAAFAEEEPTSFQPPVVEEPPRPPPRRNEDRRQLPLPQKNRTFRRMPCKA
jgi:hypothetical protein